jgi:hypothetical protein
MPACSPDSLSSMGRPAALRYLASRRLLPLLSIAWAIACGDPTEPRPEPRQKVAQIEPSSIASTGPTVTTDKSDYWPGDTVQVSGAGWQPGEPVLLEFVEAPLLHPAESLYATANDTGGISNREYEIQEHDLGQHFTLSAVGTISGLTAQTTFTDGHSVTGMSPTSGPPSGGTGVTLNGHFPPLSGAFEGGPGYYVQFGEVTPSFVPGPTSQVGTQLLVTSPPGTAGTSVPVRLIIQTLFRRFPFSPLECCRSHVVISPTPFAYSNLPSKLAVTPASFSLVVSQCGPTPTAPSAVRTQNAQGQEVAVTSDLTVALTSSSVKGAFYSDADCSSALPKDAVTGQTVITIQSGASNSVFWYQDRAVGTATITASAPSPITAATQQVIVSAASTTVALVSPASVAYGQGGVEVTATVTASAPATGPVDEGSVLFTLMETTGRGSYNAPPVTVNASGVANTLFPFGADIIPGSYRLEVAYHPGASNPAFNGSGAEKPLTVRRSATTSAITLVTPDGTSIVRGIVTVDVRVTPESNTTPFGTVLVTNGTGGPTLCTVSLTARDGTCTFTPTAVGVLSLLARYEGTGNHAPSASAPRGHQVSYNFSGLSAPVDLPTTLNVAKTGQAIPLKWRLLDATNAPVTTLTTIGVTVANLACGVGTQDLVEEVASGSSGLQNLGDGYYQFNWKSPTTYAGSCKQLRLDLGEGSSRQEIAYFSFKK